MDVVTLDSLVTELATPRAGVQVRAVVLARVLECAAIARVSLNLGAGTSGYFMTTPAAGLVRYQYASRYARAAVRSK
jgi:hypothetical protein